MECLFCGIAAGQVPAARVLESARTVAFRDINPQAPVHVLVIPKGRVRPCSMRTPTSWAAARWSGRPDEGGE
jgi:diadenosine tetraphosphate (Ap4A) HIT family hydrolase